MIFDAVRRCRITSTGSTNFVVIHTSLSDDNNSLGDLFGEAQTTLSTQLTALRLVLTLAGRSSLARQIGCNGLLAPVPRHSRSVLTVSPETHSAAT